MTNYEQAIGNVKTAKTHLQAALAELNKAALRVDSAELGRLSGLVSDATMVADAAERDLYRRKARANCVPESEPLCPGCGGTGPKVGNHLPSLHTCQGCGGLFTSAAIPAWAAITFVRIGEPMQVDCAPEHKRYFDIQLSDGRLSRVHGWYSMVTKRVVQWG